MPPSTQAPTRPPPAIAGASTLGPVLLSQTEAPATRARPNIRRLWAVIRLGMAWTFLWPFFDKMFGLGHQTTSAQAWVNGGNPTKGFLSGSTGAFSSFYQSIAGAGLVNVLFMVGLLAVGIALAMGVAMWPACVAGASMLMLMWSASLPPSDDLFLDNHIIYTLLLIGLAAMGAGRTFGLGRRWEQLEVIRRHRWLV